MKSFSYIIGILFLLLFVSCNNKKVEVDPGLSLGALHISKSKPAPSDTLLISYKTRSAMNGTNSLHAFFTYFVNSSSYQKDILLKNNDSTFTGSLIIPDSATALVYHFKMGEDYEANNKKGYTHQLYDSNGKVLAGNSASLGYYYLTASEFYGIDVDKDSAIGLIEKDLTMHPSLFQYWDKNYPRLLFKQNAVKGEGWIEERISNYSRIKELNDEQFHNLINFHEILGHKEKADSIRGLAIKKYPKGMVAKNQALNKFYEEPVNYEKQKELFKTFTEHFGTSSREYNYILSTMAYAALGEKDYDSFDSYLDQMENSFEKSGAYNNVAWTMVEKGTDLDKANQFSKKSLDVLKAMQETSSNKPSYYSEKQFHDALKSYYLMNVDTYAFVLFKQGKLEEALKYQLEAIGEEKVGRSDVNERYIQFLIANVKYDEAQKEAARFIRTNKHTSKIKDYLQLAYVANTGSKKGFSEFLEDLEVQANEEALVEIKKKMIDEESYTFALKNLDGIEVSLSSLKGKTVILDFWATWCGPCIESFPGMQIAVNKYKNDPNVVFLFINTFEGGEFEKRKNLVRDYIQENKYTFNVLFDNAEKEDTGSFVTANAYGIKGIPTKIIIGEDGRVKFKSVGFMRDNDLLVAELDLIIGLTQPKDLLLN